MKRVLKFKEFDVVQKFLFVIDTILITSFAFLALPFWIGGQRTLSFLSLIISILIRIANNLDYPNQILEIKRKKK